MLGPHETPEGWAIRAFVPFARKVRAIIRNGAPIATLEWRKGDFFEGLAMGLQAHPYVSKAGDAIAKEIDGSDRIDIARRVDDLYERLLLNAIIFSHIPALTAGMVRRDVRALKAGHLT